MGKQGRVTTAELYREIGEVKAELHSLKAQSTKDLVNMRADMQEIKALYKRVKDLEVFKSYVTGIAVAVGGISATVISVWKLF